VVLTTQPVPQNSWEERPPPDFKRLKKYATWPDLLPKKLFRKPLFWKHNWTQPHFASNLATFYQKSTKFCQNMSPELKQRGLTIAHLVPPRHRPKEFGGRWLLESRNPTKCKKKLPSHRLCTSAFNRLEPVSHNPSNRQKSSSCPRYYIFILCSSEDILAGSTIANA